MNRPAVDTITETTKAASRRPSRNVLISLREIWSRERNREVMQRTGINRTTTQRMTAKLRKSMRAERRSKALALLRQGNTRAEVARTVGLSPTRISAMFKGHSFPTKKALSDSDGIESGDEGEDFED